MSKTVAVKPYSIRTLDLSNVDNQIETLISSVDINAIAAKYKSLSKKKMPLLFLCGDDLLAYSGLEPAIVELLTQPQEEVCQP